MNMRARLFATMILLTLAPGCSPASEDHADAAVHERMDKSAVHPANGDKGSEAVKRPATSPAVTNSAPPATRRNDAPPSSEDHHDMARIEPPPYPQDLPPAVEAPEPRPFPDEVTRFMVDRDGCDHFRGEEPYDAERRAYLEQSIAELCTGTDTKLASLRQHYADDPDVIAALSDYEARIEGRSSD